MSSCNEISIFCRVEEDEDFKLGDTCESYTEIAKSSHL